MCNLNLLIYWKKNLFNVSLRIIFFTHTDSQNSENEEENNSNNIILQEFDEKSITNGNSYEYYMKIYLYTK